MSFEQGGGERVQGACGWFRFMNDDFDLLLRAEEEVR